MKKKKNRTVKEKIVRSVEVPETGEIRPVFYVRRDMVFDPLGRACHSPVETGHYLGDALNRRDVEEVVDLCWSALNFVFNGEVPADWMNKKTPVPIAV